MCTTEDCYSCSKNVFCSEHPVWLKNQKSVIIDINFLNIYLIKNNDKSVTKEITSAEKIEGLNNEWIIEIDNKNYIFIACQCNVSKKDLHSVEIGFKPYYKGILIPQKN